MLNLHQARTVTLCSKETGSDNCCVPSLGLLQIARATTPALQISQANYKAELAQLVSSTGVRCHTAHVFPTKVKLLQELGIHVIAIYCNRHVSRLCEIGLFV